MQPYVKLYDETEREVSGQMLTVQRWGFDTGQIVSQGKAADGRIVLQGMEYPRGDRIEVINHPETDPRSYRFTVNTFIKPVGTHTADYKTTLNENNMPYRMMCDEKFYDQNMNLVREHNRRYANAQGILYGSSMSPVQITPKTKITSEIHYGGLDGNKYGRPAIDECHQQDIQYTAGDIPAFERSFHTAELFTGEHRHIILQRYCDGGYWESRYEDNSVLSATFVDNGQVMVSWGYKGWAWQCQNGRDLKPVARR